MGFHFQEDDIECQGHRYFFWQKTRHFDGASFGMGGEMDHDSKSGPESSKNEKGKLTLLLQRWHSGDDEAFHELVGHIYDELRSIARIQLSKAPRKIKFDPTEILHEAYQSLLKKQELTFADRQHFFAVASRSLRRLIVNKIRKEYALMRDGGQNLRTLDDGDMPTINNAYDEYFALSEALDKLLALDKLAGQVVELRYFANFTIKETAEELRIPVIRVCRKWNFARAWLKNELSPGGHGGGANTDLLSGH